MGPPLKTGVQDVHVSKFGTAYVYTRTYTLPRVYCVTTGPLHYHRKTTRSGEVSVQNRPLPHHEHSWNVYARLTLAIHSREHASCEVSPTRLHEARRNEVRPSTHLQSVYSYWRATSARHGTFGEHESVESPRLATWLVSFDWRQKIDSERSDGETRRDETRRYEWTDFVLVRSSCLALPRRECRASIMYTIWFSTSACCVHTYYVVSAKVLQDQTDGEPGYQLQHSQAQQYRGHVGHAHRTHDVKLRGKYNLRARTPLLFYTLCNTSRLVIKCAIRISCKYFS